MALQRRRAGVAVGLAALTALCSPVAALFAALAGAATAVGAMLEAGQRPGGRALTNLLRVALPGAAVVVAAGVPVLALAVAFPEGGVEPFAFSTLWPVVLISIGAVFAIPREDLTLRAGAALYGIGCVLSYAVASPVGSNMARLAPLVAGPLAALLWWPRRKLALLAVALPLLYLQWLAPVRDVATGVDNRAVKTAYFQPLVSYLSRQPGPPFRVEIPFTLFHWEAYAVAPRIPLARGWERQLDIRYNGLFYRGRLTPARYEAWLHQMAVRFVAAPDAGLDYSAKHEVELIDRGLPYLRLVKRIPHWRIYAVHDPTPIVQGAATLRGLGPNWLDLEAQKPGTAFIHVHFSPYWAVTRGSGCVAPAGDFTKLLVRRAGALHLAIRFSLGRIGATSPRCS
jgi:hypothetical protein